MSSKKQHVINFFAGESPEGNGGGSPKGGGKVGEGESPKGAGKAGDLLSL